MGVAHDAGANLDQFELQAGQRPVGHLLRQFDAAQERCHVVGQRVHLRPHLVVVQPPARQPRPVEGVFAFLDVLFSSAALVIKAHHPVRLHRQVGDDETHTGEQLARMPFNLSDDAALLGLGRCLILEVFEKPLDLGHLRPPDRWRQPVHDLLAQDAVGGQSDGVEIARLFQPRIDRWIA